jgi:hypothetical protein
MMETCGCIYVPEYDPADFYYDEIRKAIKIHKCSECDRDIQPGEKYEKVVAKYEGDLRTYKTCPDCLSVRDVFFCAGFFHEGLWEYVAEHVEDMNGNISSECLIKLTPAAREKVCDLIEEAWVDWDEGE